MSNKIELTGGGIGLVTGMIMNALSETIIHIGQSIITTVICTLVGYYLTRLLKKISPLEKNDTQGRN